MKGKRIINQTIVIILAVLFTVPVALCDQTAWDCPECGRKGNTGNYCGGCAQPSPWLEEGSQYIKEKLNSYGLELPTTEEELNLVLEIFPELRGYIMVSTASPRSMTHKEFIAAADDDAVVIESYVQDHQSWWDNTVTVYLQSEDGAYFAYELACSEEDAAKLVPGKKIRITGYKTSWAGEVEIASGATFEFVDAEPWIAEAEDITTLLATDELINHMNEFVAVKGATIVAQDNGAAFNYKNPEEKTDDLYFRAEVDGQAYNFCVEYFLRDKSTNVYKTVESLKVGDVVDIEGFLYWYDKGPNLQVTSLTIK